MSSETVIRSSSLPHYGDCLRRSAAKMMKKELISDGYNIRELGQSIGAAVGTATHNAMEVAILLKQDGLPFIKEMEETAEISINALIENGVIWDKTTPTKEIAIKQAVRQAHAIVNFLPDIKGIKVEEEFKVNLGDDFILSGHIDLRQDDTILDLKTGATRRANQAQYGGYSLLCRSNGIKIKKLGEIYVKRIGITKPQPDPVAVYYDVAEAEKQAWEIIRKMKSDIVSYRKQKDEWVWMTNPNSMMCSADYCPAFNTNFCNCHKKEK